MDDNGSDSDGSVSRGEDESDDSDSSWSGIYEESDEESDEDNEESDEDKGRKFKTGEEKNLEKKNLLATSTVRGANSVVIVFFDHLHIYCPHLFLIKCANLYTGGEWGSVGRGVCGEEGTAFMSYCIFCANCITYFG